MSAYVIDNRDREIDWETREYPARIIQNARNLLMLRAGEVPYDRYRGIDPDVIDKNVKGLGNQVAREADRLFLWQPEVKAKRVYCGVDKETGALLIRAEIEVEEA